MIERSLQLDANGVNVNGARCATRPTDLPTENRRWVRHRKCITYNPVVVLYNYS